MAIAVRLSVSDGIVKLPDPEPRLRKGVRVRIAAGPLKGLQGLYVGQNGHECVHVLLALLGGQRQVTLPESDVEAVLGRPCSARSSGAPAR
jgi:transcription antitermination factor NusG